MEDKAFELLTKMHSEINEQFNQINKKLDSKADKTDIVRMENGHGHKLDALLDGTNNLQKDIKKLNHKQPLWPQKWRTRMCK